jgi:hypothetical protein
MDLILERKMMIKHRHIVVRHGHGVTTEMDEAKKNRKFAF